MSCSFELQNRPGLTLSRYQLNTQHPQPHGASPITHVVFGPVPVASQAPRAPKPNPLALTVAADGTAKLWQVRQAKKSDQGESSCSTSLIPACPPLRMKNLITFESCYLCSQRWR